MLKIDKKIVQAEYSLKDCRSLNRMEMIGIISCDIMREHHDDYLLNNFRKIYKGITKGPWSIQCDPTTCSINYKTGDFDINFYPTGEGISVNYNHKNNTIYNSFWDIETLEDNLL